MRAGWRKVSTSNSPHPHPDALLSQTHHEHVGALFSVADGHQHVDHVLEVGQLNPLSIRRLRQMLVEEICALVLLALDGVDAHAHLLPQRLRLLLPVDLALVLCVLGAVRDGVSDHDERALGARAPPQHGARLVQHELVALLPVPAARAAHLATQIEEFKDLIVCNEVCLIRTVIFLLHETDQKVCFAVVKSERHFCFSPNKEETLRLVYVPSERSW